MFVTQDPAAQFPNPYGYVGGNPLNRTDPNGAFELLGFIIAIVIAAVIGAAVSVIQAAVNGASGSQLLKAAAMGAAMGAITGAVLGIVGPAVAAAKSATLSAAYNLALAGYAVYGAVESFRNGQIVFGMVAVLGAASALKGLGGGLSGVLKRSPAAQGGNGAGGGLGQLPGAHAQGASAGVQPQASANALATRADPGFLRAAGRFGLDVAGKIWALPNTVIGGLVGLAGVPFGAQIQFGNNAIQFVNFPLGEAGEGLTLGNVQIFPVGSDPATTSGLFYGSSQLINLGLHEEAHTFQYQVFGPTFLLAYALSGGISASNPFELAANRYALGGSFFP